MADQIGIGLDRLARLADEIEPRLRVGSPDAGREIGMEGEVVDPDLALRGLEPLGRTAAFTAPIRSVPAAASACASSQTQT